MTAQALSPVQQCLQDAATDQRCEKLNDNLYRIDGREVSLPCLVNKASNQFAAFLVDAKAAQAMIADTGLVIHQVWPGKALLQVVGVRYIENPLGDYNEAGIIFYVRQPGSKSMPVIGGLWDVIRGNAISYVHYLPVNQDFTKHAGRFIWGYPKWNTDVRLETNEQHMITTVVDQGRHIFTLRCDMGGRLTLKDQKQPSLAVRNGMVYKTQGLANGTGARFRMGGYRIELGDHPIADELRSLGLPKKPLFSGTVLDMYMSFSAPVSRPIGTPIA